MTITRINRVVPMVTAILFILVQGGRKGIFNSSNPVMGIWAALASRALMRSVKKLPGLMSLFVWY